MKAKLKSILRFLGNFIASIIILGIVFMFYRGCEARKMLPLQTWHKSNVAKETLMEKQYESFAEYLAAERKFLDKVYGEIKPADDVVYSRYRKGDISSPIRGGVNYNASFHVFPPDSVEKKGGVMLVHGLTDSPYHMRAVADVFARNGYYVACLRLPGHGTIPKALADVTWQEWYDAVKFSADIVQKSVKAIEGGEFFIGGFSTGGALTLRYVLDGVLNDTHTLPNKLFLFSPAIGVDLFAEAADWHQFISWIPGFEQFRWLEIKPEYDPFKYNSFPKNAGDQIFDLTKANSDLVEKLLSDETKVEQLPPIYAFQSLVDATVKTDQVIELFAKIASQESELVLFDVNRTLESFMKPEIRALQPTSPLQKEGFKARLIVMLNEKPNEQSNYLDTTGFFKAYKLSLIHI